MHMLSFLSCTCFVSQEYLESIEEWLARDESIEESEWVKEFIGTGENTLDREQAERFNRPRGGRGGRGGFGGGRGGGGARRDNRRDADRDEGEPSSAPTLQRN